MEVIRSVNRPDLPGGAIIRGVLKNGLMIRFTKDKKYYYNASIYDVQYLYYTTFIFKKIFKTRELIKGEGFYYRFVDNNNGKYYIRLVVRDALDDIEMEYGWPSPPSLTMKHKYFDKFIAFVENLCVEDLEPDPFCG